MATALDLQEQEQLDEFKAFWNRWGNLLTWLLIAVMGAYAAWNGWNWWQRNQGVKAGAQFDAVEQAVVAGDLPRAQRVLQAMQSDHAGQVATSQAALRVAHAQSAAGQLEPARATLQWLAEHPADPGYGSIASLRLAGVLMTLGQADAALKALDGVRSAPFAGLAHDRRGDILMAQGKRDAARDEWKKAWDALDPRLEHRRTVGTKLASVGASPVPLGVIEAERPLPAAAAAAAAVGASR